LRVLRSNLTLSSRATVCCLPWPRSGHGAEASADMFTMRRAGLCPAGTPRVWIYLRGVLGIGLGSGAVGQSQLRSPAEGSGQGPSVALSAEALYRPPAFLSVQSWSWFVSPVVHDSQFE
jgi:hypothetical protein